MNAKTTEQKTAVFTPCAESAEATRAFPVLDEDTRELPLIADRFAGRYWDGRMEKETDETGEKPARKKTWRSALAFGAAAVAAMLLLVGSLTGQAELTAMNDELVAVSEAYLGAQSGGTHAPCGDRKSRESRRRGELRRGNARHGAAPGSISAIPAHPSFPTGPRCSTRAADRPLRYFWENLLDTVMACF